jgi:hypothetical protein
VLFFFVIRGLEIAKKHKRRQRISGANLKDGASGVHSTAFSSIASDADHVPDLRQIEN